MKLDSLENLMPTLKRMECCKLQILKFDGLQGNVSNNIPLLE